MVANLNKGQTTRFNSTSEKYYGVYEGIVKEASDFQNMGRLGVWVPELGTEENDSDGWVVASYITPFGGSTNMDNTQENQTFDGTQRSYGFWAVPPDTGNRVAVQFINGEPSRAIWIGSFYQQYRNTMVPNIPAGSNFQYDTPVPSAEPNFNLGIPTGSNETRPYHREHYESIRNQGLETDPVRGYSQNGATSDPLSRVYGMLTPKGHYWSMEDTDRDSKIRIRTAGGAQILLDDTNSIIYITNQKGNGWVEIDGDGKMMIFSEEGIGIRSAKDISFTADKDLIFESGRNTIIKATDNIIMESFDFTEKILNNKLIQISGDKNETIENNYNLLVNVDVNIKVDGDYVEGIEGDHNKNVMGSINTTSRGDYNQSSSNETRISSAGEASFSSQEKTNIISNANIVMAGSRVIQNTGGSATPADPPKAANPEIPDIPVRPTYEREDVYQKPEDDGTMRRRIRSISSTYPTHEPSPQHSEPPLDRDENLTQEEIENTPVEEAPPEDNILENKGSFMESLFDDLRRHEGVVYRVYPDPLHGPSKPTAGIGHLLTESEKQKYNIGDPVEPVQVDTWFAQDVEIAINGCQNLYGSTWEKLNDTRKQVLINMCFNLGVAGLGKFKRMKAALANEDYVKAAIEMEDSDWFTQVPGRAAELQTKMLRG